MELIEDVWKYILFHLRQEEVLQLRLISHFGDYLFKLWLRNNIIILYNQIFRSIEELEDLFPYIIGVNLSKYKLLTNDILSHFSNVRHIYLNGQERINDEGLSHFSNVRHINLDNTNITDEGLKYLGNVTSINLDNTNITDEGLKYLGRGIKFISLCGTNITDEGLKYLGRKIKFISLYNTNITDEGLKYLCEENNIGIIDVQNTNITDKGLKYLSNIKVILLNSDNITNEGLKYLSNVNVLFLNSRSITDTSYLPEECSIYSTLDLGISRVRTIKDFGVIIQYKSDFPSIDYNILHSIDKQNNINYITLFI